MREFFGAEAGLSPATIVRLTEWWQKEREEFMRRELSERDYVYVWLDTIHEGQVGPRDKDRRQEGARCLSKRLPGVRRVVGGVIAGPEEARDAGSGFGGRGQGVRVLEGGRDVFLKTCHQRDWVHKRANVLDALPKSARGRGKKAIKEITEAENKAEAKKAVKEFASEFGTEWPRQQPRLPKTRKRWWPTTTFRALAALEDEQPDRVAVCDGEARTYLTKEPGSREVRVAMIYQLLEAAEGRWRKLNEYRG